jgi:class 3 adenylate cyclase
MREDSPLHSTIAAAQAEGLAADAIDRRVWAQHGTTCAMLALDSSGMTRVTRAHGIVHFLARYFQVREVAQAILAAHGCRTWRSFADNLFAELPTADAGLAAALDIHRTVRERGIMLTADEPYRVCIAVGHGRVLANGAHGVLGDEMNIVAKLAEDFAGPGDTLLTEAGYAGLTQFPQLAVEKAAFTISRIAVNGYRVLV